MSGLSGIPVRGDVAMTGEITLHGNVLPIGGLREKSMAAYREGMKTVLIPKDNEPDLYEVDDEVKKNLTFLPMQSLSLIHILTHGVTLGYLEQNAKLDATLDLYGEMRLSLIHI